MPVTAMSSVGFIAATNMNCDGKSYRAGYAGNRDPAFLHRLPHGLQHAPFELRQLIQEEDAVMCQRDFDRGRVNVAAKQSGIAAGWPNRCSQYRSYAEPDVYSVIFDGTASRLWPPINPAVNLVGSDAFLSSASDRNQAEEP